ncbi:MAG: HNH endonuclease [Abditibacteriota bacterium]|nr:HNH endonuclease [Abditibacteriota bacterium]
MEYIAEYYDCNHLTYDKIYEEVVKLALKQLNITLKNSDSINNSIITISGKNIYAKRSNPEHSRTIIIRKKDDVNDKIICIVGITNTSYDEDKQNEGGKYVYGKKDYHANTYLSQGINKIFEKYLDLIKSNDNRLFFYLLDTEKPDNTYVYNKTNIINYRLLETLGFHILNIDKINFSKYNSFFTSSIDSNNLKYTSFSKLINDITRLNSNNSGNNPSYIKEYEDKGEVIYYYMCKVLSAQQYDNFLKIWTLKTLARNEGKTLNIIFYKEKYNYRKNDSIPKETKNMTKSLESIIKKLNIEFEIIKDDKLKYEKDDYRKHRKKNDIRNQTLLKNNLINSGRKKECSLCGNNIDDILEVSHILGVSKINDLTDADINKFPPDFINDILIDNSNREDVFNKKYSLANCEDNAIWLCANHHKLYDSNKYHICSNGKIEVSEEESSEIKEYLKDHKSISCKISDRMKKFLELANN